MPSSPLKKGYVKDLNFKIPLTPKKYNAIPSKDKKQQSQNKICRYSNVIQMKGQNELIYGITSDAAFTIYQKKLNPKKQLDGRALFIYPQNIVVSCQYKNGNLHKQCIIFCKNVFLLVLNYDNGLLQKQQINFSYGAQLLTKSLYKKNILQNITKSTITSYQQNQFDLKYIFKDKSLLQKIQQVFSYQILWAKPIKMGNTIYYGQINDQNLPQGLGAAIVQKDLEKQIYFGNFQDGLLSGIGCISFYRWKNYSGQFQKGQFVGIGKYFQNNKNIYMDGKQKISEETYRQLLLQYCFDKNMQKKNERQFKCIQNQYCKLKQIYSKNFEYYEQKKNILELKQVKYQKKLNTPTSVVPSLNLTSSRQYLEDQQNKSNEQDILIDQFNTTRNRRKTKNSIENQSTPSKKSKNEDMKKKSIFKNNQTQNKNQKKLKNSRSFKNNQGQYYKNQINKLNQNDHLLGSKNLLQKRDINRLRKASTQIIQADQQQLSWEQLSNDSNYVQKQYSFMMPNKLQTYPTFNKTQQLMKNQVEGYVHPQYMKSIPEKDESYLSNTLQKMYKH